MRFRPQDYAFRRNIEAKVTPAARGPVEAVGLWIMLPILIILPAPTAEKIFGSKHVHEIEEAEERGEPAPVVHQSKAVLVVAALVALALFVLVAAWAVMLWRLLRA